MSDRHVIDCNIADASPSALPSKHLQCTAWVLDSLSSDDAIGKILSRSCFRIESEGSVHGLIPSPPPPPPLTCPVNLMLLQNMLHSLLALQTLATSGLLSCFDLSQ